MGLDGLRPAADRPASNGRARSDAAADARIEVRKSAKEKHAMTKPKSFAPTDKDCSPVKKYVHPDIQRALDEMEKLGIVRRTGEFRDGLPLFELIKTVTFDQAEALIEGHDKNRQ